MLAMHVGGTARAFDRTGTHDEHGTSSLGRWLELYAAHAHDHADQIRQARGGAT
jgi:hypothetical protein